jgi:hypothetical protein
MNWKKKTKWDHIDDKGRETNPKTTPYSYAVFKISEIPNLVLSAVQTLFFFFSGTGSYPEVPQGWHLDILLIPKKVPLKGPCILIAWIIYSEQVGTCLHDAGVSGDMAYR